MKMPLFLKSYGFSILLIASLFVGAGLGLVFKKDKDAAMFKTLGDVFLNLLFQCPQGSAFSSHGLCCEKTSSCA
jgi:hypothetical protein